MTLMKAKKPLALLLALLAALSLLGTTALAAGLPEETIAAQTELCGEDCGHTHEEVFSHTEHTEESLPEPEEIAVPVATPLLEHPEPEAGQPSDTSGVIPGSGIYWELNEYGWLMLSGNGSCPTFVSPDDQPWAAVREQITQVWFEDMDALSIPSLAYWFTGCTALTMAEIPYTTPVIGAAAFADCPSLRQIQLYYSGAFTIVPGAFSTGSLTPLLVLFIPEYDSVLGTLAAYDWTEDRRAAYFEDVYGITLLATGYCSNCKRTCSYTVEYEQWTNSEHCVRHWCSNCGYDQAGGVNGEAHSFRSGVCSKCGYCDDCGYLLTRFSVIVPAGMTLTVSKTGTVYAASNVRIVNRSTGAVSVSSVTLRTENGWTLVPFSTNMATEKVDSRKIGFSVNGAQSRTTGAEEALPLGGGWRIPGGEALPLHYDAVVSASSRPISEQVLTVIFVLEWVGA